MEIKEMMKAFAALAQETRMAGFRLLASHEPDGMAAGEIARYLGVPQNTMSAHLKILAQAGLISSERQGRVMMYRADVKYFYKIMNFMVADCCRGKVEKCFPAFQQGLKK